MWRQPGERDGDDNQRNENPSARDIFALADANTAAPRKAESGCAGQREDDEADARRMCEERGPIAPTPNEEREKRQRAAESKSEVRSR